MIKYLFVLLLGLSAGATVITEANAAVCAKGVNRAGCVGPRGAVVTHRGAVRPYARGYARGYVRGARRY